MSDETRLGFVEKRIAELRQAALESKEGLTVKRLEAHIVRMEQKHERLVAAAGKDDGVRFEQTGIAAEADVAERAIMNQTRHQSLVVAPGYIPHRLPASCCCG